jgi:aryl-alcohol dehydrogenase-like predicted oxidoreductase
MKYRMLGKTGLKVSEIGFGCGNIGGLMVRAPFEERLAAVRLAMELGINYFDTAAQYGNGQSEKNLGEVLTAIKPKIIVATKFAINREDLTDIRGAVRRSLEASLKRLNRDSVDIFQLHTPVAGDQSSGMRNIGLQQVLGSGGVADALDQLRSEGLIRFMGFTGLGETTALHQILKSRRFDLCQAYCNLLNPTAAVPVPAGFSSQDFERLILEAVLNNMGVAAIRVLAGGALGGEVSRTGYAAPSVGSALTSGGEYGMDQKRTAKLSFLLKGDVKNLSQAGIRFVLGQPGVSVALVGFSNLAQIEESAACSTGGPLPESDLPQLEKVWAGNFNI